MNKKKIKLALDIITFLTITMKTDTIKKEPVDPTRGIFKKGEMILKDKNLINEKDKENTNERTEDDKSAKSESQLEKHTETEDDSKKEKEDDKENIQFDEKKLSELLIKKCTLDEKKDDEIISRSPMRTQEFHHHHGKPYGFPYSASSKTFGGVTRVVEPNYTEQNACRNGFTNQWGLINENNESFSDIDIEAVGTVSNLWINNPGYWEDFVNKVESVHGDLDDLNSKEISNRDQYRNTRRSVCSSSSSQFSSPAPSPSEYNGGGSDYNHGDESSLYYAKSPNIPALDGINIQSNDDLDKILDKPASPKEEEILHELQDLTYLNIPSNLSDDANIKSPNLGTSPTLNIGEVMLNLASDPYESRIDLSQYAVSDSTNSSQSYCTYEKDCLNERLDPKQKESAWARISQLDVDLLGKGDKEGDTQLMILLVSEKVTLAYIYVIVERLLKENANYLSSRNELNQDALYLAALKLYQEPVVASYIAEALIRGKQEVNMKYDEGDTLLHGIAKQGDSHAEVLRRLLQLRNSDNTPAFDVNKKNNRGFTPLHLACQAHKPNILVATEIVQILLEHGASCTERDYIDENTPLHTLIIGSCDADLLDILLSNAARYGKKDGQLPTTIHNRQLDTALHLACRRNTLPLQVQKEVVEILLRHGAMIQLKNINGAVPSVLVDNTRKAEIKNILHSYRQK